MVSLKDIAKDVDLNVSVVSRALNPKPDAHAVVASSTKRRIVEAAKRLGYRRNRAAEFLKRGKAATIGIFLPAIPNRLVADLMIGISEKAAGVGFPLNFFFGTKCEDYQGFFHSIDDASHSGVITYPFHETVAAEIRSLVVDFRNNGGNILVLNTTNPYLNIPVLAIDNVYGGRLAGQALLQAGCGVFLTDDQYKDRTKGLVEYLEEHGEHATIVMKDDFRGKLGDKATKMLTGPVGVFATSDEFALDLYRVVRELGHAIGRDVRIVGYDNLTLTEKVDPPLTTIHQPFRELGARAVEKLVNMIYGEEESDETIKPSLVEREST